MTAKLAGIWLLDVVAKQRGDELECFHVAVDAIVLPVIMFSTIFHMFSTIAFTKPLIFLTPILWI